jgi:hypothetical protein
MAEAQKKVPKQVTQQSAAEFAKSVNNKTQKRNGKREAFGWKR